MTMQQAAVQASYILKTYLPLLSDLTDAHRAQLVGSKTAGWLVGHLVVTGDFGRRLCGLPPMAPKEWRPHFSPGTTPSVDAATYPPMTELVKAFRAIYTDLTARAPTTDAAHLTKPNPYEPTRETFPTAGEFVAYLMSGHLAYHLGQLSGWRTAIGLGS